jgi:hypothetical protein
MASPAITPIGGKVSQKKGDGQQFPRSIAQLIAIKSHTRKIQLSVCSMLFLWFGATGGSCGRWRRRAHWQARAQRPRVVACNPLLTCLVRQTYSGADRLEKMITLTAPFSVSTPRMAGNLR